MEKVRVEPAGMKITVRNDEALSMKTPVKKRGKPPLQNPARKGLRITMANPDALKVL